MAARADRFVDHVVVPGPVRRLSSFVPALHYAISYKCWCVHLVPWVGQHASLGARGSISWLASEGMLRACKLESLHGPTILLPVRRFHEI